jgi:hypothetical protein
MKRHRWTEQDDIVALYFYKFGDLGRTSSFAIVGERRGMGAGSLRMRVGTLLLSPAVVVSTMPLYNRVKSIDGTLTCRNPNCGGLLVCDGDGL